MKTKYLILTTALAIILTAVVYGVLSNASSSSFTAFNAKDIAGQQVPKAAHDQVIQIHGERNVNGLYPVVWHVLFWDATAAQNGRAVTVRNGTVSEIKDGYVELDRMRLAAYKKEEILNPSQLQLDSNQAYQRVSEAAALKNTRVDSVEFLLTRNGDSLQPVWHLTLYTKSNGNLTKIGQAVITADTGQILEIKLDNNKA